MLQYSIDAAAESSSRKKDMVIVSCSLLRIEESVEKEMVEKRDDVGNDNDFDFPFLIATPMSKACRNKLIELGDNNNNSGSSNTETSINSWYLNFERIGLRKCMSKTLDLLAVNRLEKSLNDVGKKQYIDLIRAFYDPKLGGYIEKQTLQQNNTIRNYVDA